MASWQVAYADWIGPDYFTGWDYHAVVRQRAEQPLRGGRLAVAEDDRALRRAPEPRVVGPAVRERRAPATHGGRGVAERAGMSAATASRALRGMKVHRKYQGKAEAAAAELQRKQKEEEEARLQHAQVAELFDRLLALGLAPGVTRPSLRDLEAEKYVSREAMHGFDFLTGWMRLLRYNLAHKGHVDLYATLSAEATSEDHPAHEYFKDRFAFVSGITEKAFTVLKADGRLNPGISPHSAARIFIAISDGLQMQWLMDPSIDTYALTVDSFKAIVTEECWAEVEAILANDK